MPGRAQQRPGEVLAEQADRGAGGVGHVVRGAKVDDLAGLEGGEHAALGRIRVQRDLLPQGHPLLFGERDHRSRGPGRVAASTSYRLTMRVMRCFTISVCWACRVPISTLSSPGVGGAHGRTARPDSVPDAHNDDQRLTAGRQRGGIRRRLRSRRAAAGAVRAVLDQGSSTQSRAEHAPSGHGLALALREILSYYGGHAPAGRLQAREAVEIGVTTRATSRGPHRLLHTATPVEWRHG